MPYYHTTLRGGGWRELSLAEQLGNVGGEVSRALRWREKDPQVFHGAINRALELLDLTIQDPRWRKRLKEIVRVREFLCDTVFGRSEYNTSLEDLDRYFLNFALAARLRK